MKSYIGWIPKKPRIHTSYHFCDSLKNDILGLKMKILKFLGIQPNITLSELHGTSGRSESDPK